MKACGFLSQDIRYFEFKRNVPQVRGNEKHLFKQSSMCEYFGFFGIL